MATPEVPPRFGVTGRQPEAEFEIRTLPGGSLLRLGDGRQARVVDNPHDGVWLICEIIADDGQTVDDVETVMCYDVAELVEKGPAA